MKRVVLIFFAFFICLSINHSAFSQASNTSEYHLGLSSVNFMMRKYGSLNDENVRKRIDSIWKRINQVADKRSGIQYSIDILDTDEVGAWAFPGGFVTITKGLISLAKTDDELAFVIAHEIGHQAKGHVDKPMEKELEEKFSGFIAEKGIDGQGLLHEFINGVSREKELEADQYGFLYASLAGYNVSSAFTILDKVITSGENATHPDKESRQKSLHERVNNILGNLELFRMGVIFYNIEEYNYAESLFRSFLSIYPSREVYNNLAVTLHQKAFTYQISEQTLPTIKDIQIDKKTRAEDIGRDISSKSFLEFQATINQAIENYKKAIDQDPDYVLSYNNLACAYDDIGEFDFALIYLKKAIKIQKNYKEALNNIGVINIHLEDYEEAIANFEKAIKLDSQYAIPYFNMAVSLIALNDSDALINENLKKFLEYGNGWHQYAIKFAKERLGIKDESEKQETDSSKNQKKQVFQKRSELEKYLGTPSNSIKLIPNDNMEIHFYMEKGTKLITYGPRGKVIGIIAENEQAGTTPKGVSVNQTKKQAIEIYGKPDKTKIIGGSIYYLYVKEKVLFAIQDGLIKSWFVFAEV